MNNALLHWFSLFSVLILQQIKHTYHSSNVKSSFFNFHILLVKYLNDILTGYQYMRSKQERTSYAWYVTENKDKVQNNLNLGNEIFNQGRSKAKISWGGGGWSNVLNFSKFGPKLKRNFFCPVLLTFSKNWGDFPKNFQSSYGCYE